MSCRWADRLERRKVVNRGEPLGCLEDLPDVVVTGDDPVIQVGTIEDRDRRSRLREEGVGIGKVGIMKGIETLAPANARIPAAFVRMRSLLVMNDGSSVSNPTCSSHVDEALVSPDSAPALSGKNQEAEY